MGHQAYNNNNKNRGGYNNNSNNGHNNYMRTYHHSNRGNQHQHPPSNYAQHPHHHSNHRNSQYSQQRRTSFHSTPRRNHHYTVPPNNGPRSFSANQNRQHSDYRNNRNNSDKLITQGSRSRNIRKLKEAQNKNKKQPQTFSESNLKQKRLSTPPIVTRSINPKQSTKSANILQRALDSLSLESMPFKFNYRSKRNLTLLSAKNANEFAMDPNVIYPWHYLSEIEKKTQVREYMLPCLKLLNNLMACNEAIDFILAPNQKETNPDFWTDFRDKFDAKDNIFGKNMCFEWIRNLLKSDFYETVDDFANSVRLIWENVFSVFGIESDHEWVKNARFLQLQFEEKMILISRKIPNAKEIFVNNGNPRNDPLQIKELETEQNKLEIQESLNRYQALQKMKESAIEPIELSKNDNNKSLNVDININEQKKKRQQYLANIDTRKFDRKRRKSTKQTLKKQKIKKMEDGEIQINDDCNQWTEIEAFYEFVCRFNDNESIGKVVMLQEGFDGFEAFEAYKKRLNAMGSDPKLKKAKIDQNKCQEKVYEILKNAKNEIIKKNVQSIECLNQIFFEKKKRKKIKNKKKAAAIDPFSNEAIMRKKQIAKEEEIERQRKENEQNKMVMDEESEDEFFDENVMEEHSVMMHDDTQNQNDRILKSTEIGKDDYQNNMNQYRPIRPSNVSMEVTENENVSEHKSNSPINKNKMMMAGDFEKKWGYQNEQMAESSGDEVEF